MSSSISLLHLSGGHPRGDTVSRRQPQRGRGGELPGESAMGETDEGEWKNHEIRGTVDIERY